MEEHYSKVPVIDCSKILRPLEEIENTDDFKSFVQQLGHAMSKIGFVYFVNHGIPNEKVTQALEKSKELFELPLEVKQKYRKTNPVENVWGYTAPEDEGVNEKQRGSDSKECFDFWSSQTYNASSYPKEVPGLGQSIVNFRECFKDLTIKVLRAFALYLELPDHDYFITRHSAYFHNEQTCKSHNDVRTNYYSPMCSDDVSNPNSSKDAQKTCLRLGEHNDWGTVTFLYQDDIGGLEAKLVDGSWIPVPPIKDSFVLNAGIMLEMWSGGTFPATAHRVKTMEEAKHSYRQSIGFFLSPDGETVCLPLVKEVPGWKPLYPQIKDGETQYEYFKDRIRGSRANAY